jgi:lipopolysaccharide transport system ATP-binding protein
LGFSLATARRPDILIVDEALSVGDDAFQHKSFERIRELRARGTTLLLVSHAGQSVMSICDRAVLLEGGRLIKEGDPEAVFDFYHAMLGSDDPAQVDQAELPGRGTVTTWGSGEAGIEQVSLTDTMGRKIITADVGSRAILRVTGRAVEDLSNPVFGFVIKDRFGQPIYGTNTMLQSCPVGALKAGDSVTLRVDLNLRIGAGSYSIAVALHGAETHLKQNYSWRNRALLFKVVNRGGVGFVGGCCLEPELEIER